MLVALLVILIVLWFLGYTPVTLFPIPNPILFSINGHPVSLWNLLILILVAGVIGILPRPFREIASVLLLLWILSILGIFFFAGLSNILVIALIVGLLVYILGGF